MDNSDKSNKERFVFWKYRNADTRIARHRDREFFGVVNRGSVELEKSTGEYFLKYYATETDQELSRINLKEIKTEPSAEDTGHKLAVISIFFLPLTTFTFAPFLSEVVKFPAAVENWSIYLSATVLYSFLSLLVLTAVRNKFIDMDKAWGTSIADFLSDDCRAKMTGIRTCMLQFRAFIKWRRYIIFFNWGLLVLFPISYVLISILLAILFNPSVGNSLVVIVKVWISDFSLAEAAFAAMMLLIVGVNWWWLQRLRFFHTEWRDPTVQLSVMAAEAYRKAVANLRARGAGR